MEKSDIEEIQKSFTVQAGNFNSSAMNFSREEYLDYIVKAAELSKTDRVLEVAAGTCACGRAMAPHAASVACLDITPAMLAVGKREAEKKELRNMVFVQGDVAKLPFLDESFDVVISRLAFHHFREVWTPFREMARVLRHGGKLMLIDMEAAEERLRDKENEMETWRDPSHVRNLSRGEMKGLFSRNALEIIKCESTKIPVNLEAWLELTKTPDAMREKITACMLDEIAGNSKTGFAPYREGGRVYFEQRWLLTIGKKP